MAAMWSHDLASNVKSFEKGSILQYIGLLYELISDCDVFFTIHVYKIFIMNLVKILNLGSVLSLPVTQ